MSRFSRFVVALVVLTAMAHAPFALALEHALRTGGAAMPWVWAILGALGGTALIPGRLQLAQWDRPVSSVRRILVEEAYYVHWCALIAATPLLALGWLASRVAEALGADRTEPGVVATTAYAAGLTIAAWAVLVRRRCVRVRVLEVPIAKLSTRFDGFRIVQLSDLHVGSLCPPARARRWVRIANGLEPDLVVLTGDYVTTGVAFHRDIAEVLAGLRAPAGVVAVLGNHDYFGEGEPLIGMLRKRGVTVLRNERHVLVRGDARLAIAGVDDAWTRRADVERTMAGSGDDPVVALAHDPRLFSALAARGAALVLCGHTHWGQIAIPFFAKRCNLSALSTRFAAGLHRIDRSVLYVSPGLGTTGPPARIGAPPEITLIRLRAPNRAV